MKDYLLELASKAGGGIGKLNIIREYLQAYILRILYENKFFNDAAFCGGTALRFVYDLPRFSEDLDFALHEASGEYQMEHVIKAVKNELTMAGYEITVISNFSKTVQYALLKFKGLKYEAGISPHKEERFTIKIDLDTNPPGGADVEKKIKRKFYLIPFRVYKISSLFSGKLHALLCRKYVKGRDWYDLMWFLSGDIKVEPNFVLLNNAIEQTEKKNYKLNKDNWRDKIMDKASKIDFKKIRDEVRPLLEETEEAELMNEENFYNLLKKA